MHWAWHPISSEKPFSGYAKALCCDPTRLGAGGKALADGPNDCTCRLFKTLSRSPNFSIQETTLKLSLYDYEGDEE